MTLTRVEVTIDISVDDFNEGKLIRAIDKAVHTMDGDDTMVNNVSVEIKKVRKQGYKYAHCKDMEKCKNCPEVMKCDRYKEMKEAIK